MPVVDISDPSTGSSAGANQKRLTDLGYSVPLRDEDGSVTRSFGASPDKVTAVVVDREGFIRFRQAITSTPDTNTELAEQIKQATN